MIGRLLKQLFQLSLSLRIQAWHLWTCTCARLLGPCFKTGWKEPFCQQNLYVNGLQKAHELSKARKHHELKLSTQTRSSWHLCQEATCTKSTHQSQQFNWFLSLSFQQFQTLLTLFSKSFSSFPHGTCLLSVSSLYLALDEIYHPLYAPLPRNATLRSRAVHKGLQMQ